MAGLSQSGLAKHAGVSRDTIARVERGEGLGEASLRLIASALDLPPNYFLGDEEPEPAYSRFKMEMDFPPGMVLTPNESRLVRKRMIEFFHIHSRSTCYWPACRGLS